MQLIFIDICICVFNIKAQKQCSGVWFVRRKKKPPLILKAHKTYLIISVKLNIFNWPKMFNHVPIPCFHSTVHTNYSFSPYTGQCYAIKVMIYELFYLENILVLFAINITPIIVVAYVHWDIFNLFDQWLRFASQTLHPILLPYPSFLWQLDSTNFNHINFVFSLHLHAILYANDIHILNFYVRIYSTLVSKTFTLLSI